MSEDGMKFDLDRRMHFRLVKFTAAGISLAFIASHIPRVYAGSFTIPKLSYNPNTDQLLSDFNVQREMLAVDLKATEISPVFGKGAMGYDETYVDFILAKTAQTAGPTTDLLVNVDVDRKLSRGKVPGPDDFSVECDLQIQTQQKISALSQGTGLEWGNPESLTFPWNIVQKDSYFSPNQTNYIFALQIPISYIGRGGPDGQYGFFIAWVEDGEKAFPGYPAVGDGNVPNTWASFSMAAQKVSGVLVTPAAALAAPLFLARWRMSRINRKRIEYS
jgi:hypothetical protein